MMTVRSATSRPRGEAAGRLRDVAEARARFLASDDVAGAPVREQILASWKRSRGLAVVPDHLPEQQRREWDDHGPLLAAASPILRHVDDLLTREPVSVVLTDAEGVVLHRSDADAAVARHLDLVGLALGFSYAESQVGTNGIGTALTDRQPTWVDGSEHYSGGLQRLACAGSPIHHPATGELLGVLDLTSWRRQSRSLMLALVTTTAEQIEQAVLDAAGQGELALYREYLRATRRTSGIVLAVDRGVVMMNDAARRSLSAADQSDLMERAGDLLESGCAGTVITDLPSGARARVRYRPLDQGSARCGGILDVALATAQVAPDAPASAHTTSDEGRGPLRPVPAVRLPGLVGTSATWQRCVQDVLACRRAGEWVVLQGEPGTGKRAVLEAAHHHVDPAGHLRVVDAGRIGGEDALDAWLDVVADELAHGGGALVLTHADQAPPMALRALGELLQHHDDLAGAPGSAWVAVTTGVGEHPTELDACLLPHFPRTLEVPSLRHHSEDVPDIARALVDRLAREHRLTFDHTATQQLARATWPGNVTQLQKALADVTSRRRGGVVTAADLPPETLSAVRRRLTPLESLERDAIVSSLLAHGGNKALAGADLGMSRATIYRKIRDYGITGV